MIKMEKITLQSLRRELCAMFAQQGIESPEADSGLLLMYALKLDKTRLLLDNRELTSAERQQIFDLANRRMMGEPIWYIIGRCPFMDLEFSVNSSTLIPRPETELLVEEAAKYLPLTRSVRLWDIGCGSGCIGITLAHLRPKLLVTELDISPAALDTARITAVRYGLADRISFVCHDIMQGMPELEKPRMIVSNPPYIPSGDIAGLQKEVRDFEPAAALDGGADGLDFYRRIIADAPLESGGILAFEIGFDQGIAVTEMMERFGYRDILLRQDYAGLDRIVIGRRK